jgi:DNA-directed RNA polymerase specialized sigma24 family protein
MAPVPAPKVAAAAAFLAGPGRRVAARAVAGLGLPPHLAEDVAQEALLRLHRAEQRGEDVANVEAFTTVLVQRSARDLLRGVRRRPEGHAVVPPIDDVAGEALVGGLERDLPEAAIIGAEVATGWRRRVVASLDEAPRPAAGALAVLAILLDGAGPADDCPVPKAGAGDDEAIAWAGLFYAGRRECFPPPGQADDPATRKRRSRAVQDQRRVLHDALGDGR